MLGSNSNRERFVEMLKPLIGFLASQNISPVLITFAGLGFSMLSGVFFAEKKLIIAFIMLVTGSVLDGLDGAVARANRRESKYGAFLDSVSDRYADAAIFIGIGYYLGAFLLSSIAFMGAFLVSYTKARGESLGENMPQVIGERADRLVILLLGTASEILLGKGLFAALFLIAVIANLAVFYRILKAEF